MAIMLVAFAAWASRRLPARPSPFVSSANSVSQAEYGNDSWYWLEQRDKTHQVLVRADSSGHTTNLVTADEIGAFYPAEKHLLTISRTGKSWTAVLSDSSGTSPVTLCSGSERLSGALISNGRAFFLKSGEPSQSSPGEIVALQPTTSLLSTSIPSGALKTLTTVYEKHGLQVIGVSHDDLFFSASRDTLHGVTAIYRVSANGGIAKRIVGETGVQNALVGGDGALYWTAPAHEAQNYYAVSCIRRMLPDSPPQTLTGWMAAGGRVFEFQNHILYVDGSYTPAAIQVRSASDLPNPIPLPAGYIAVAANKEEILVQKRNGVDGNTSLFLVGRR